MLLTCGKRWNIETRKTSAAEDECPADALVFLSLHVGIVQYAITSHTGEPPLPRDWDHAIFRSWRYVLVSIPMEFHVQKRDPGSCMQAGARKQSSYEPQTNVGCIHFGFDLHHTFPNVLHRCKGS